MARIDKLRIQGIRSFGPEDESAQQIAFSSPITCIVGQNGCGKTTIIEALRYATTGNAPPSTTGGKSFVYDPKLTQTGEVKGQARLQFFNVKGEKMQVTRTMQVNQKLDKLEMKSVEPSVHVFDENDKSMSLTGRCTDVKKFVLDNLGISEAILDNVIFCHQDESLWPLDEGKKLKEKFDDIFDASKYNKASDCVSKIRKAKEIELDKGKQKLGFLLERHQEAQKKRSELDKHSAKFAEGTAKKDQHESQLKPLHARIKKTYEREKLFQDLQARIASKESDKKNLETQQRELKQKISKPHEGSKRDLEKTIKNFHQELQVKKEEISEQEGIVTQLLQQEKDGVDQITQQQTRLGKLQQEEETHEETVRQRLRALDVLAKELNLHGLNAESVKDKDGMANALKQVELGVKAKDKSLQNLQKALQNEEQNLQKDIDTKRERKVEVSQMVKSLEGQLSECQVQLRQTKDEINQAEQAVKSMSVLQARLDRASREYEEVGQQMSCEETQGTIKDTQDRRDRLQDEVQALDDEVEALQRVSSLVAEIDVHKTSMKSKEAEIAQIKEKRHDELMLLFNNIPERNMLAQLDNCIKRNETEMKDLRKLLEKEQTELTKREAEVKHRQQKLVDAEELLQKHTAALKKECGDQDFETTLSELEEGMRKARDQKGVLDSSDILFRRYVSTLKQKDPCCPLCHRDFKAIQETEKLIAELNIKMETLPAQKKEVLKNLSKLEEQHSRLLQLKPAQIQAAQLKATEIPKLREELENEDMCVAAAAAQCESLRNQLKAPENKHSVSLAMRADAALLEQHETEVKKLDREIQRIEQRLPNIGTGRTMEEAQEEQKRLRAEVQRLQREAEVKQRELDAFQKRVADLREQRNTLKEELLKVQSGAQKRAQLMDRRIELAAQEEQLTEELEVSRSAIAPAENALLEAERAKEKAQQANLDTLDKQRKILTAVQGRVDTLKKLHSAVEAYEARGVAGSLKALRETVNKLQERRELIMNQRQQVRARIDELQTELTTQQLRERELQDNLVLLEKREQCEIINEELEDLCSKLGSLDYVALMEEKNSLSEQITTINEELARLSGSQTELKDVIKGIEAELSRDLLKNAEAEYNKQLIKNKVMAKVIKDLFKYFKSLNQSMIHFHQERMESVNRIIRELWVSIYKGSDIDYIAIRTDGEAPSSRSTSTRRTYNYRVVMVKRDTELDMRGRCSAGQKMLASLVIRIALAETFSANCGILALDEPTTNLDVSNIESLCAALTELANNHKLQRNFQLLVITHDENFIETLTRAGLMNFFYRVTRNEQSYSTITKFRVA